MSDMASSPQRPLPVLPSRKAAPRSRKRLVAVVLVVLLLAAVGVFAYETLGSPAKATRNSSEVVSGLEGVTQGSYNDYSFTVQAGASSSVFNCTFTTKGGDTNVIEVFLMNATVFAKWSADHANGVAPGPLPYLYSGGKVNSGSFTVPVAAGGTYYLVLNDVQPYNEVVQVSASVVSGA